MYYYESYKIFNNMNTHSKCVSILKGLGIILVVVGHTSAPVIFKGWIYSFHMPLFFLLSGYLFKENYINSPFQFIKRKIKGLYLPFIKWGFIFVLLHNFFFSLNFYHDYIPIKEIIIRTLHLFFFRQYEGLLGAYWFIPELFYASIFALGILVLIENLKKLLNINILNRTIVFSFICILYFCVFLISDIIFLGTIRSVTLLGVAFFLSGIIIKQIKYRFPLWISFFGLIVTFFYLYFYPKVIDIFTTGPEIFLLVVTSYFVFFCLFNIAERIEETGTGKIIDIIGSNTLIILTLHFVCFKIWSFVIILRDNLDPSHLMDFPYIITEKQYDWWMYSIIGIGIPICIVFVNKFMMSWISKSILTKNAISN